MLPDFCRKTKFFAPEGILPGNVAGVLCVILGGTEDGLQERLVVKSLLANEL